MGADLRGELRDAVTILLVDMHRMETRLIRWLFLFFIGMIVTTVAFFGLWG